MGTRGAFGVRIDGEDKLMYNHFDSYPEQLGNILLQQLQKMLETQGLEKIQELARALQMVSNRIPPTAKQILQFGEYANYSVSTGKPTDWYVLLHDLQGDLENVLKKGILLRSDKFMSDSLFCEWAYIWNLDDKVFEIYKGTQKKAHKKGRYAGTEPDDQGYYGVALIATIPFGVARQIKVLSKWMDEKGLPI